MSLPMIVGTTISVDFGDKNYGNGSSSFMNISAKYPEPGQPFEELPDVVSHGLSIYFQAWKTLMSARFATGALSMNKEEFKNHVAKVERRIDRVLKFLATMNSEESNEQQQPE